MLTSDVCSFMIAQGYVLVTWVYPNVIFERINEASASRTKRVSGWEKTTPGKRTQERVAFRRVIKWSMRDVRVRRGALMTRRPHGAKLRALHREVHAHGEIITSGVGQARGALAG
jgi:hypothetical protein